MKRILLIGIVLLASIMPALAQNDTEQVLPDAVMKQAVGRLMKWYFKPRRKPGTIFLSRFDLKEEWLPTITGIRFVLLDAKEYHHGRRGYRIRAVRHGERAYEIGFGYGNIGCPGRGVGDIWEFHVANSRVRLFPRRGSWLWACDADANLMIDSPAGANQFFAVKRHRSLRRKIPAGS